MYSLHPVIVEDVRAFLALCREPGSPRESVRRGAQGLDWLQTGDSRGSDLVTHSLALYLAEERISFASAETTLTHWEASIERGIGMLLRPPARLFVDAGMERAEAQQFPIRLDPGKGMMAGAFVPAHLISQLGDLLERRLERQLRRMIEAEIDPVANMGWMIQAVGWARENGFGLLEAMDVVDGGTLGGEVVPADRERLPAKLRKRLEAAAKPLRKPGLVARLLGSRSPAISPPIDHHLTDAGNGWHDPREG